MSSRRPALCLLREARISRSRIQKYNDGRRWSRKEKRRRSDGEATEKRRRTEETRELAEILVSAVDSPRRFNSFDVHEFAASSFRNASLSLRLAVIVVAVAAAVAAASP